MELSKRNDLIKRLSFERGSQVIEIVALKTQVEATLKEGHLVGSYQVEFKDDAENVNNQAATAIIERLREPQANRSEPLTAETLQIETRSSL